MFRNKYANSEASEVAIKGDQCRIEFQRQSGQVSIVGEIAGRAGFHQKPREQGLRGEGACVLTAYFNTLASTDSISGLG